MKVLSHDNMQAIHSIRLWVTSDIQTKIANDDPDFYENSRYDEPSLEMKDDILVGFIKESCNRLDGFRVYKPLIKVFGSVEKLEKYILETFKQESNLFNSIENN